MLHISKLWHKNKSDELPQSDSGEESASQISIFDENENKNEYESKNVSEEPDDTPCLIEVATEPDDTPCLIEDAAESDAPLCAEEAAGEPLEIVCDERGGRNDEPSRPLMCGEQLKMPSCAMNSEPVVNFASATSEENMALERPVFNLLTNRTDRDDRLTSHPGFKDVRVALARWQNAVHYFESVTNPDLIDFAIYELEAAKRQYVFLLQLAKEDLRREGILASGGA